MKVILYAVEVVVAVAVACGVVAAAVWLWRAVEAQPLWLPVVGLAVGVLVRVRGEVDAVGWLLDAHDAVRRRCDERGA